MEHFHIPAQVITGWTWQNVGLLQPPSLTNSLALLFTGKFFDCARMSIQLLRHEMTWFTKGGEIRDTKTLNLSRNIVALPVERVVARISTARSTCLATDFGVASWKKLLQKVELGSTLCNMLLQFAALKFVASQVERAVEIRATTRSTGNATMLRYKLRVFGRKNKNTTCLHTKKCSKDMLFFSGSYIVLHVKAARSCNMPIRELTGVLFKKNITILLNYICMHTQN